MGTSTYTPVDELGQPMGDSTTVHTRSGQQDDSEVPKGASTVVLEWVGYDPERAKAALTREHGRDAPRKGLIEALERVLKED